MGRKLQREALGAIAVISSVVLIASVCAFWMGGQHQGRTVNLLELSPRRAVVLPPNALAQMDQFWEGKEAPLEAEKQQVGKMLAGEMRKVWASKSKGVAREDMEKVQILKHRYDSIVSALEQAPVLTLYSGPNGELRAYNPETGSAYQLYEYHAPGGYEDAELDLHPGLAEDEKHMGDPFKDPSGRNPIYQGEYPEYRARKVQSLYEPHPAGGYEDAELDLHPGLAQDQKEMGEPFKDPIGRNPVYQGEYPEYKSKTQALYEPHPAGGYEDAELDLHAGLAQDQKEMGEPFQDPIGRNPVYQGEYPEYKARTQSLYEPHPAGGYEDAELDLHPGLAEDQKEMGEPFQDPIGRNPVYQGEYPEYKSKTQALYEPHPAGGYEDAELDLHPGLAQDQKEMGEPFQDPIGRNPVYQGEYPEYVQHKAPMLYEYHVPGDYEDAELDLHPGLAEDQKHMGQPFVDPAGRNPVYQGEYPEYMVRSIPMLYNREAAASALQSAPMVDGSLANRAQLRPERVFVVRDRDGRLRLLSPAMVRGMRAAPTVMARQPVEAAQQQQQQQHQVSAGGSLRSLRGQIMAARRARRMAAAAAQLASPNSATSSQQQASALAPAAAAAAAPQIASPRAVSDQSALPRRQQHAADEGEKFSESGLHVWGTVYNPTMDRRNKVVKPAEKEGSGELWGSRLSDEGRKEYGEYAALADEVIALKCPHAESTVVTLIAMFFMNLMDLKSIF